MKRTDSKQSIPVNEPFLGELEFENVAECLRTGWISSSGRFIEEFERQWAAYCGRRYGIAVSNGSTALQVAISCLHLEPGDEIILPTFTIISCITAVLNNGGTPVLVDSDPRTWCMDVSQVEAKITSRTRALMPVHIYGHPVQMDPVLNLARQHEIAIIEDAAEAHGAECLSLDSGQRPTWRRCGNFGLASTFSFYANKLITTGEGGMVLTDDPQFAEEARSQRNLCFQPGRRFKHEDLGFNFRLTNIQAAIGVAQIQRINEIVARKRHMAQEYNRRLQHVPGLQLPAEEAWARNVYWMYGVVVDENTGLDAFELGQILANRGIETRPFFLGMHEQPALRRRGLFLNEHYPVAERLARQGLYLPSGLALTEDQLHTVCEIVTEVMS
jgi:perosamine synthetase